jgi:NAD(P)-dependent dehydrogenase (short-subunit alcohol dehydrogenase family)
VTSPVRNESGSETGRPPRRFFATRALTLTETMVATGISAVLTAALLIGSISLQRSWAATKAYGAAKADQMRLTDYLAMDLRRALAVTPGTDGTTIVVLRIPDYYAADNSPRTPTIAGNVVNYGDPAAPVTVTYFKSGDSIYRRKNDEMAKEVATGVSSFNVQLQDLGKVVKTEITFAPRFSPTGSTNGAASTAMHGTILLRNKRRDR